MPAPQPPAGAERLMTHSLQQPTVWRTPLCVLSQGVERFADAPELVCDFGRELHGGVRFVVGNTTGNKPVKVRVTFGESVAEALATPNQDHAIHQWVTELPWAGIHEVGCTGFRFVRIELLDPETHVELHGLCAVTLMRPEPIAGAFECSDPRINAIWQTSVHTLGLCMQDSLWDGVKRDRLVWAGDLHPEVITALNVFGAHPVVRSSMAFLREDAPMPKWMNSMPTYSMWWAISLRDWWLHTADEEAVRENWQYVDALMQNIAECVTETGEENLPGRFLDWASAKSPEAVAVGTHALTRIALLAGADLARTMDDETSAARWTSVANRLCRHEPLRVENQQANALRVLAGLAEPGLTNDDIFSPQPTAGLSPFYGYYVLEARAMAKDHRGCLDLLRHYWGGMLDMGGTAFWEHFDSDWLNANPTRVDEWPVDGRPNIHRDFGEYCYTGFRHSLCHGWSSGPAAWLSRNILGVMPAAPGFARVRIQPHLGDLEWARGTVPTPHGPLHVSLERTDAGRIETRIELPDGVQRAPHAASEKQEVLAV